MNTDQHDRSAQAAHITAGVKPMQAIVQDSYGEAGEILRLEAIDKPEIGPDEVLLCVRAAGVDRGVSHLMTGLPYPIRIAGYGLRAPKTRVRGREVAGRVEVVGADVTTLAQVMTCSASARVPSPSTPALERTSSRPSRSA